jgi:hypothetical protein
MFFEYQFRDRMTYDEVKKEFFGNLTDTFLGYIRSNGRIKGYPEHLLTVFIAFDLKTRYELDYELDYMDFRPFNWLELSYESWSDEEWMSIYELFSRTIKFSHRLNPFIRLFFYDLVYLGPFGEDIEALDMSDELLDLMGYEMKKLNNLFDKYSISDDSALVRDIAEASKVDSIPAFAVIHLANWINEHVGEDKRELGDLICELYIIAIEKILKKPKLTSLDKTEISSIFYEVDTSNFTDAQTDHVYSCIGKYNVKKIRKSTRKGRRRPPRFRC